MAVLAMDKETNCSVYANTSVDNAGNRIVIKVNGTTSNHTPHPLEDRITFRVQTRNGHPAVNSFKQVLIETKAIFTDIREKSTKAMESYRANKPEPME